MSLIQIHRLILKSYPAENESDQSLSPVYSQALYSKFHLNIPKYNGQFQKWNVDYSI